MTASSTRREHTMTGAVIALFALAAGWWLWQALPPALGQASGPPPLAVVGQLGGEARAVAVERGRAVLGVGQRIYALDVNDPAKPVKTAESQLLAGTVRDLALGEGYAFAALGQAGVVAVDLLPQPPLVVAHRPLGQDIGRLVVAGGLVYAVGPTRLFVLDPATLTVVGQTVLGAGDPAISSNQTSLALAGEWAYVLRNNGLDLIHVADPAAPARVGEWHGRAEDVAAAPDGRHVLLARGPTRSANGALVVLDVSDPRRPRQVAELAGGGRALALNGNQAWLIVGDAVRPSTAGLRVVDVTDPRQPRELGYTPQKAYSTDLAFSEGVGFLTADGVGLRTLTTADPARLETLGGFVTRPVELAVLVSTTAYVVAGSWLQVVDVTSPGAPRLLGELDLAGTPAAIAARGTVVYLATAGGELRVVDASDPAAPRQLASVTVGAATIGGLSLTTRYLYLATEQGMLTYDVSTPTNPRRLGQYAIPCSDVAVPTGGRAYLTAGTTGLVVLDVRDPAAPRDLGRLSFASAYPGGGDAHAEQVLVSGPTAYLDLGRDGLRAVDVQDPAKMRELAQLPAQSFLRALALAPGEHLLAATYGRDPGEEPRRPLQVIDWYDPRSPRPLVGPAIDAPLTDVTVDGGRTAVAAGAGGLLLLIDGAEAPPTPTLIARDTATPRPRPTRPPATPDPAWRRKALLPFALSPLRRDIPCPPGCGAEIVGQLGGSARQAATEGERLYLLVGERLEIYSLSGRDKPALLGQTAPLPGTGLRLLVKNGVVYILATVPNPADTSGYVAAEILAVDARDPAAPRLTGRAAFAQVNPDLAEGLQLAWWSDRLLVLWPWDKTAPAEVRLSELTVSDPLRPRVSAVVRRPGRFQTVNTQLAVVGKLVTLAGNLYADTGGPAPILRVLDLESGAVEPKVLGQVGIEVTRLSSVVANDKYVFLGDDDLVRVVDVSFAYRPKLLGWNEAYRVAASSLALAGTTLYGASTGALSPPALNLVDVRDPYRPARLGTAALATPTGGEFLAVSLAVAAPAGQVFIPEGNAGGLRLVDAATPAAPRERPGLAGLGLARCLASAGDHLLAVWPEQNLLGAFALADPVHPAPVATAVTPSELHSDACRLLTAASWAYLGRDGTALETLDVSDPARPRAAGHSPTENTIWPWPRFQGLAVAGGRAWRAYDFLGLLPMDVTDPNQVKDLARVPAPQARDLALAGGYAYVAAGPDGLSVLDARDPASAHEVGYLALDGLATELAWSERALWVAVARDPRPGTAYEPATLLAVDVTDPARPRVLASLDLPGRVRRLRLDGATLWVASEAGLLTVAAGDPSQPRVMQRLAPETGVLDVAPAPGWAYAASDSGALWSLRTAR